jgi:hypothetical protein
MMSEPVDQYRAMVLPTRALFFGCSYFGPTFLTEAFSYVLHVPGVEHLPAILASVIAHDPASA